jgi:hypothetical protein
VTAGVWCKEKAVTDFDRVLGDKLYNVRREQHIDLDDLQRMSYGRWQADLVRRVEQGLEPLSLPEVAELASFFDVPLSSLLPAPHLRREASFGTPPVVIDLDELEACTAVWAGKLRHYTKSIQAMRGDHDAETLAIRHDDITEVSRLLHVPARDLVAELAAEGVLLPVKYSPDNAAGENRRDPARTSPAVLA